MWGSFDEQGTRKPALQVAGLVSRVRGEGTSRRLGEVGRPERVSRVYPGTKAVGISPSSVRRIWKGHGLQPHRVRAFKLSNDAKFAEKLKEVVGLYIDPPAHAVVLSLDEKSQIQALDRTQPGLPMKKGRCATMTHDDKRHGTTPLFAAPRAPIQ